MPLPVTAVQILWINLVTDGVATIPIGLEPRHSDVLEKPPRRLKAGIIYPGMVYRIAFLALIMAPGSVAIFVWKLQSAGLAEARTIAFCALVAFQWFNALNARSDRQSLFKLGFWSNPWLLGSLALGVILQLMVVYVPPLQTLFGTVPLGAGEWGIIAAVTLTILLLEEIRKIIAPRLFDRGKI